jgi:cytochrome c
MMSQRLSIVIGLAAALLLQGMSALTSARAADPQQGQSVFRSQCAICHSVQQGRTLIGPSLYGIVGRRTGSEPGYAYSTANKNANLIWTPEVLDKYLNSPQTVIPGTKMPYGGLKDPTKRADIIAYLATLR